MSKKKIKFYDTNAILKLQDKIFEEKFILSSVTLQELENIKISRNKEEDVKYNARKILHLLDKYQNKYDVVVYIDAIEKYIEEKQIEITPDSKIVASAAFSKGFLPQDEELLFVTDDISCKVTAKKIFGLEVCGVESKENIYKGYKVIKGTSEEINIAMNDIDFSDWDINEYLIIQNTDDNSEKEMRFDGEKFVNLKLPSSKFIKAKNGLQRCALDALLNPDITIVAVLGTFGSGKTYMAMQMGLYAIQEKGTQSKLVGIREIIGEGKEPGYLPGDLDSKVGAFFDPLVNSLKGGIYELENLKQSGVLETNIPHFMKGITYPHSIVLCDEAEDLSMKQIRLIGTRLGEGSRIFFSGDYKQSLIDLTERNALIEMCKRFKGNPKFSCICLDEDVRSETSKMFAELL